MKKRLMRVRRLVEYVGDAEAVRAQLDRSMKLGKNVMSPAGCSKQPQIAITVSQLGPAEFVDGDDEVTVAAENAEEVVAVDVVPSPQTMRYEAWKRELLAAASKFKDAAELLAAVVYHGPAAAKVRTLEAWNESVVFAEIFLTERKVKP